MTIAIARHVKHASLALIALSSVVGLQSAYAVGTDAGTADQQPRDGELQRRRRHCRR